MLPLIDNIDEITSQWKIYKDANDWLNFKRKSYFELRKSLGTQVGSGLEAHHKVPLELLYDNEFVQAAVNQGFDFNGFINGKALRFTEHRLTNGDIIPAHRNYTKFVNSLFNDFTDLDIPNIKSLIEDTVLLQINKFLDEAETLGKSINDHAISKGF